MKLSIITTGLPPASAFPVAFPRLELTPGDLAAVRNCRIIGALVRACQLAALVYGVAYAVKHGGASGPVVGVLLAWFLGLAMPKLPVSVSDKIAVYIAREFDQH